jgi:hypothetical protein
MKNRNPSPKGEFIYALYAGLLPIELKIGESRTLTARELFPESSGDGAAPPLAIQLAGVEQDARSYTGTVSGAAVVAARVSVGETSRLARFNLWDMRFPSRPSEKGKQGGPGNMLAEGGYQIYLVRLLPYREAGEKIDPSRYAATFMVDRIESFRRKQKAIDLASAEVSKRLAKDADRYWPVHLGPAPNGPESLYRVIFRIPYGPTDSDLRVDVDIRAGTIVLFDKARS